MYMWRKSEKCIIIIIGARLSAKTGYELYVSLPSEIGMAYISILPMPPATALQEDDQCRINGHLGGADQDGGRSIFLARCWYMLGGERGMSMCGIECTSLVGT